MNILRFHCALVLSALLLISLLLSSLPECAAEPFPSEPVIGGRPAAHGSYPWMVALLRSDKSNPRKAFFCGGSLIDAQYVLTAAHCVVEDAFIDPHRIQVLSGTKNLSQNLGVRHEIARIVVHPEYDLSSVTPEARRTRFNDLALIELATPVTAQTIALADADEDLAPDLLLTGWGETLPTSSKAGFPVDLQEVALPLAESAQCSAEYGVFNQTTQLCVGLPADTVNNVAPKTPCSGDSGGPLMGLRSDGKLVLAGIVSYGAPSCGAGHEVFTRVSAFRDWITTEQALEASSSVAPKISRIALSCGKKSQSTHCKYKLRLKDVNAAHGPVKLLALQRGNGKLCNFSQPGCVDFKSDWEVRLVGVQRRALTWEVPFKLPKHIRKDKIRGPDAINQLDKIFTRFVVVNEHGIMSRARTVSLDIHD